MATEISVTETQEMRLARAYRRMAEEYPEPLAGALLERAEELEDEGDER